MTSSLEYFHFQPGKIFHILLTILSNEQLVKNKFLVICSVLRKEGRPERTLYLASYSSNAFYDFLFYEGIKSASAEGFNLWPSFLPCWQITTDSCINVLSVITPGTLLKKNYPKRWQILSGKIQRRKISKYGKLYNNKYEKGEQREKEKKVIF